MSRGPTGRPCGSGTARRCRLAGAAGRPAPRARRRSPPARGPTSGTSRSLSPLPTTSTRPRSRSTRSSVRPATSLTRRPDPYISSRIARSRSAIAASTSLAVRGRDGRLDEGRRLRHAKDDREAGRHLRPAEQRRRDRSATCSLRGRPPVERVDRADAPRDRGARVPERRELREEPPQVVDRRAGQGPAGCARRNARELREVAAVGVDGRRSEVALEREVIARSPSIRAASRPGKVVGRAWSSGPAAPLVPTEVGSFKQRSRIGGRPCANRPYDDGAMELDLPRHRGARRQQLPVLTWGDEAAVVDPQRDVDTVRRRRQGPRRDDPPRRRDPRPQRLRLGRRWSSARRPAPRSSGPAGAGYAFGYRPVEDGTEIAIGDATLVGARDARPHVRAHSPTSSRGAEEPIALFSGGSLIVGERRADRPARPGADRRAHAAAVPLRCDGSRTCPTRSRLLPTHGAGSFCATSPPGERRTSTIGEERATQPPRSRRPTRRRSCGEQLTGLIAFPDYYAHMAPINRAGPPVLGDVPRLPRR